MEDSAVERSAAQPAAESEAAMARKATEGAMGVIRSLMATAVSAAARPAVGATSLFGKSPSCIQSAVSSTHANHSPECSTLFHIIVNPTTHLVSAAVDNALAFSASATTNPHHATRSPRAALHPSATRPRAAGRDHLSSACASLSALSTLHSLLALAPSCLASHSGTT